MLINREKEERESRILHYLAIISNLTQPSNVGEEKPLF